MTTDIAELIAGIRDLERRLAAELEAGREAVNYTLRGRRVVFEKEIRRRHRLLRTGVVAFLARAPVLTVVTAPVIYALIVPLVFIDLAVAVYQAICFRAWGIARVRRADFVVVDRHRLAYLNMVQKINCLYCGYANGVLAFATEIASRTEQYWCPIKHARPVEGAHRRMAGFVPFGDAEGWRERNTGLRDRLRER